MGRLTGKVAFISGVARGQGRSHAVRLAEEGCDIIGFDLCEQIASVEYPMATQEDLDETVNLVEKLGRRIVVSKADVRDLPAVQGAAAGGVDALGRLDIIIANAGIMPITGEQGQQMQAFYDAIDVMLTGAYHTVFAALDHLLATGEGGSIVLTSSVAGLKAVGDGFPGTAGYAASKHGLVGLMRTLALTLGPKGIRVNSVHPTGVNSPMVANEAFGRYAAEFPHMLEQMKNLLPVEMIECSDVSNAIVWLASDEARYVTGQTLAVDAGATLL